MLALNGSRKLPFRQFFRKARCRESKGELLRPSNNKFTIFATNTFENQAHLYSQIFLPICLTGNTSIVLYFTRNQIHKKQSFHYDTGRSFSVRLLAHSNQRIEHRDNAQILRMEKGTQEVFSFFFFFKQSSNRQFIVKSS